MMSTLPAARSASASFCSALRPEAADHLDAHGKSGEALLHRLLMLKRQHRRRRENGDLLAVHHGLERRAHGDFGLAVADVAAQQAVHRRRRFHVALDVGDRRHLIGRQVVFEGVLELLLPVRVGAEGVAGHGLARGVELEELLRHVAHRLLDPALGAFPGRAAQPIERRPRRAGVLLDEIQPFDRHEQLVVAGVAQLEKLLQRVADADLLEADERPDPVIDVDDEIADLQIAQVRQKRLGGRFPPLGRAPLLLEDVGLGVDLQAGVRQPEAAGERRRWRRARPRTARLRRDRRARRRRRIPSAARSSARRGPASPRRRASSVPRRAGGESRRPSRRPAL